MTFWITLNYDVEIKLIADNLYYNYEKDIYTFIDCNGNEIMSLFGGIFQLEIVFEKGSIDGHVDISDGHLIVDGYYNDCGKYVSYHKDEL